jgi:hypothetical protein
MIAAAPKYLNLLIDFNWLSPFADKCASVSVTGRQLYS